MTVKSSPVRSLVRLVSCTGHAYAADGQRLAVVRPKRPAVALAVAQVALRSQDRAMLSDLPGDDYTLVGWLGADGASVVDDEGRDIDTLQRGDSFVSFSLSSEPPLRS